MPNPHCESMLKLRDFDRTVVRLETIHNMYRIQIIDIISRAICITVVRSVFMAALCNGAGHYIFALWFLFSSFFSSPNLSLHRLNVYHTSTHGVALVRI